MRKNLLKMSVVDLKVLASDISVVYVTHEQAAKEIADYYRAYGLKWDDLVARYGIVDFTITRLEI